MINDDYKKYTRELTIEDVPSALDVLKHKSKVSKIDKEPDSISEYAILDAIKNHRIIGYYEDNKLVSFLVQVIGKKLSAWHMTMLATNSEHTWNYKKNGLEYCWANAMDHAEKLGIYKIYWSLPSKWARTQRRTYMTTDVWYRYDIYIEDIILPNNYPKWEEHKTAFGDKLKPHEVTVKLAVLKNEYRSFARETL